MKAKISGKYEIVKEDNHYFFNLRASNGELLCSSESYSSKNNCLKAIETFKKLTKDDNNFTITEDKRQQFQIKLFSTNRKLFLNGESYKSKNSCLKAMSSIKRFADSTRLVTLDISKYNEADDEIDIFNEVNIKREPNGKFEVIAKEKTYAFRLKASNGVVLLNSALEYSTKNACLQAIETLRSTIEKGYFKVNADKNKNYQFRLYNEKKRLAIVGETYPTKQNCLNAIESVCRFAIDAKLIDIK